MPFTEQKASIRYEMINGSRTPVLTPETEVTLTNIKTGQEYFSDAEALADVQNKDTATKAEDIRRDVKIIVEHVPLGNETKL
jgi:hypothetical protein|tara:strand:+ start:785 stop:1030 length:246 start_codon:yes stop_codon:yes gene_type:complete